MGCCRGGLFAALIAGFVIFHGFNGGTVGVFVGDGQVIVRPVPRGAGIDGNTLIVTGAGTVAVMESVEEVMQMLDKKGSPK